jgi:3-hydroxyacyl-CoA dehydrogenase/enoyl-CoA hydratase/3-hydroxybutyryl-CoA epimerase
MTTENEILKLRMRDDGVAVLTYDVPGEAVNTLKAQFTEVFTRVFAALQQDPAVKAAILVSGKADTWIAGADIEMLKAITTATQAEEMVKSGHRALAQLTSSKKPLVAAVHGAALGGGFEVALACHGRIASDDKKTVFALPEVQLGLLPGLSGLQRLAALTNLQTAMDFGLTGKNMKASTAKRLGVVSDVVPAAVLEEAAARLALRIAAGEKVAGIKKPGVFSKEGFTQLALEKNPVGRAVMFRKAREMVQKKTGGHYPSPGRILDVLKAFADGGLVKSQAVEARAFGELVTSNVAQRLMEIFFAVTALKKDNGVDDPTVQAREVQKVGMLGAGLMGAGIAYVTANNAKIAVRLKDRDDEGLGRGLKYVNDIWADRVKKKRMSPIEKAEKMALVTATTDYSGLSNADVVIEAVFEELSIKHRVLAEVEEACGPDTIFASNTSSLPIAKIAAAAKRPENVVGMHYFSPVHKMPLLEIIRTPRTAPQVVATAVALGKKQGKTVIVVNDGTGFYTSRILGPLMNEAAWLLQEGCAIDVVDKAMQAWGWPVGPITLLDEVGIDVAAHVGPIMLEAFGARMTPPPTMPKLVEDGRKGRKNEKGFYLYGAAAKKLGKGKHVDTSIYTVVGLPVPKSGAASPVSIEEIQMRCSLQFVNEAMHCWGEGILRSPRDGDIGAIFGLGFPPFRGGPFRFTDGLGAAEVLRRVKRYHDCFGARWTPAPALVEAAKSGKKFYG